MTTNKPAARKPRRCIDCKRTLNKENSAPSMDHSDMCDDCFHIAGLENEHMDGAHADDVDGPNDLCPSCTGEAIADRSRSPRPSTIPTAMQSHAACYEAGTHPKTKAGRDACRKGRNA